LELDPRNTYTLQQLAASYYYMRRYADQAAILDRALAILPNDAGLRVTRAGIALRQSADPGPLHATIDTIVAENPAAAPGFADEWLYLGEYRHGCVCY
jgi:tetratricopeptide (TPR) repeat protein